MTLAQVRGSAVDATVGTTWANTANAVDGTYAGASSTDATAATWTNASRNVDANIDIGGFDFSGIPAGATINSVTIYVRHSESPTARVDIADMSAFDGGTQIGATQSMGITATTTNYSTTAITPTLAQLQSAGFLIRVDFSRNNSTVSTVCSVFNVDIEVDYTEGSTTLYQDVTATVTVSATLEASKIILRNLLAMVGIVDPGGFYNSAEGGTDGVPASTGNTGGASGDAFTVAGTSPPTFSTAAAKNGSLGYSVPSGSATGSLEWLHSPVQSVSLSFWFYTAGTPGADIRLVAFRNSVPSNLGGLLMSSARKLRLMVNTSGYAVPGTIESPTLTASAWYLVQLAFTTSNTASTGSFDFAIYDSSLALFHSASGALPANVTATGGIARMWMVRPLAADFLGATYFDDVQYVPGRATVLGTDPYVNPGVKRDVGKIVSGAVTATASFVKDTAKTVATSVSTLASLLAELPSTAYEITVSAVSTVAGSLSKAVSKTLTDTVSATATAKRDASKTLADTVTTTATAARATAKSLSDVVTASATISASKVLLKTITATVSTTASMTRQTAKTLLDTVTTAASFTRAVAKTIADTVSITPTLAAIKARFLTLAATVTTTATARRATSKTISDTVSATASFRRAITKTISDTVTITPALAALKAKFLTLAATVTTTATTARATSKTLSDTVSTTASVVRSVSKTLTDTVTASASLTASRAFLRTLTATVATTASVRKAASVTRSTTVSTTASLTRAASITLRASVTTVSELVNLAGNILLPGITRLVSRLSPRGRTKAPSGSAARFYARTGPSSRTEAPDGSTGRLTAPEPSTTTRTTDPMKEG